MDAGENELCIYDKNSGYKILLQYLQWKISYNDIIKVFSIDHDQKKLIKQKQEEKSLSSRQVIWSFLWLHML